MKLYKENFSPNALLVRAVALKIGIDLRGGGNKIEEYLAINPTSI